MTVDTSKFSPTTMFGVLSAVVVTLQAVKFDVAGHLCMTTRDWVMLSLALCLALIGKLQQDAGKQEARVPGKSGTELVDAHQTPDNPAAVPVVKA